MNNKGTHIKPIFKNTFFKNRNMGSKAFLGTQHVASYQLMLKNGEKIEYSKQSSAENRVFSPEEDVDPIAFDILADLSNCVDTDNKCFNSAEVKEKMINLISHELYHNMYVAKHFLDCLFKDGKINKEIKITKEEICKEIMSIQELE